MKTIKELEKGCGKRFRLKDDKYDYEVMFCGKKFKNDKWLCPICISKLQLLKDVLEVIDKCKEYFNHDMKQIEKEELKNKIMGVNPILNEKEKEE